MTIDVDLDIVAEAVNVRLLHCKLLFIVLAVLYLLEEVIMHSPYLRNRNVYSTSLREGHLHKLFEAILYRFVSFLSFIYLFNHLITIL